MLPLSLGEPEDQRKMLEAAKILLPQCGICMDQVSVSESPLASASRPSASSSTSTGIRLSCLGRHTYCLDCFTKYVLAAIDPQGDGSGQPEKVVFPIPCPECTLEECPTGVTDDDALRSLSFENSNLWVRS